MLNREMEDEKIDDIVDDILEGAMRMILESSRIGRFWSVLFDFPGNLMQNSIQKPRVGRKV